MIVIASFKHRYARIKQLLPLITSQLREKKYKLLGVWVRLWFRKILYLSTLPLGFLFVCVIRAIKPWLLVRFDILYSYHIGHFAANTELYLCERDAGINVPQKRYVDLWYNDWPVCNPQLARMWSRVLRIWPSFLLVSASKINAKIAGGEIHRIGSNASMDRDVYNLLDRFPSHLQFTAREEERGKIGLRKLGIPENSKFICLNVRDGSYLNSTLPWKNWDYHSYRNSDIKNYVLVCRKLVELGYYVVRMGVTVKDFIPISHPMIIDYAANGKRTDFMDIYLGAKCEFCISTSSGFDAVPLIFRRPIVFVNSCPVGIFFTSRKEFIGITKHHFSLEKNRDLTLSEIFSSQAAFMFKTANFEAVGIKLEENSPEEICDVVMEMVQRLNGEWQESKEDRILQEHFWEIFREGVKNRRNDAHVWKKLHGEIRSYYGANFLRNNPGWLS